jgi:hypothetical protein
MVTRFICKGSGSYMSPSPSETGHWVSLGDYEKLRQLLEEAKDSLITSVPLRGDSTQGPLITKIETALEEG